MTSFKKKDLTELVGGDVFAGGNDRNITSNSEIETGPVQKPYNDDSDYEKGQSTTTDKVFGRYRQNIPWFAVYSFGGTRSGASLRNENNKNIVVKKNAVEEKIEDLVKKSKDSDVTEKGFNPKFSKIIDMVKDIDLSDKQIEDLEKALIDKKNSKSKNI